MPTNVTPPPAKLPAFLETLPFMASAVAVATGSSVLIGWLFKIEEFKRVLPGFVAMNPMSAALFICTGLALAAVTGSRTSRISILLGKFLATFVGIVALMKLLAMAWSGIPGIDQFLFASKLSDARDHLPNRMAPNTALNFLLVAMSMVTLDWRIRRFSLSQGFTIVAGFGALLPLTGYLYGVQTFRALASFTPMALHSAVTFLILAAGIFFARPDAPLAQVFAVNDPRGVIARRLFPTAVFITLLLGWLRVQGERREYFDSEFGTALFAISSSILLILLVRWTIGTVGKLEAERALVNARLHDLNRRKDEMIAVVSHDLCTPLTGFRMVIELLRDQNAAPDLLDIMDQSARRMVSMVRGLLDVAKLESEQTQLECEEVRVSDIIRQSMEPLSINADAKQIALRLEIRGPETMVDADRLRLSQVFNNLLSNAVKFTAPGGYVTVTIQSVRNSVCVTVEDTGLGIPENDLPHIFDKYYQASSKPTAGEKGTGLGLAIVRELVQLHDGKIDVTSEVDRGTAFVVSLPAKRQAGVAGSKVSVRSKTSAPGAAMAEQRI